VGEGRGVARSDAAAVRPGPLFFSFFFLSWIFSSRGILYLAALFRSSSAGTLFSSKVSSWTERGQHKATQRPAGARWVGPAR
jgi:hypothetical protein